MTTGSEAAPRTWQPGDYLKFADLRVRPALDLLTQVPLDAPQTVTDLGCGAGNITPFLRARWAAAEITALDSSAEMIEHAKAEHLGLGVHWGLADVRDWAPSRPQDLIYSNAVLHWINDHAALFPRLMDEIAPGGVLAVQMPRQHIEPSHVLIREVARTGPWAQILTPLLREDAVAEAGAYYDLLQPRAARLNMWETTYAQMLDGDDPVLDWIGSTALRPLLEALNGDLRDAYREALAAELRRAYPKRSDGKTLFAFRRLFIVAEKG